MIAKIRKIYNFFNCFETKINSIPITTNSWSREKCFDVAI